MDIKDFKARKQQFERDLQIAIQGVIDGFEKDTGYSPYRLNVSMNDLCEITENPQTRWYVASVDTEIKL